MSIEDLDRAQRIPCVDEHRTFIAKFPLSMQKKHPCRKEKILSVPLPEKDDGRVGTLLMTEEREGVGLDLNAILSNIKLIQGRD